MGVYNTTFCKKTKNAPEVKFHLNENLLSSDFHIYVLVLFGLGYTCRDSLWRPQLTPVISKLNELVSDNSLLLFNIKTHVLASTNQCA